VDIRRTNVPRIFHKLGVVLRAVGTVLVALASIGIGLSLGGVVFCAAVVLYNKLAGGPASPRSVLVPGIWKGSAVTLVSSFNAVVVSFLVGLGIVVSATAAGAGEKRVEFMAPLISIPVGLLLMAATISAMLPTRFLRAIPLTLCYLLLNSIVVAVVEVIAIIVSGSPLLHLW